MLLEIQYTVQFSRVILRKIWNAMHNQYNRNIKKCFCKNKQMQILIISLLQWDLFKCYNTKSWFYLKWESPRLMWEEKGKKKLRNFRKDNDNKTNKSIKECWEFGGGKQYLLKDISTYKSIIRVWKRISSIWGMRGCGVEISPYLEEMLKSALSPKRTNLRSKGLCISCKGRLEGSSSKNRFGLAVRKGAGMCH